MCEHQNIRLRNKHFKSSYVICKDCGDRWISTTYIDNLKDELKKIKHENKKLKHCLKQLQIRW